VGHRPAHRPPETRNAAWGVPGASMDSPNETTHYYIMALLAALQVQSTPNAPYIIIAFIAFTAALYCVPTLFRFFKNLSNPAQRAAQPADDTVYVCHDEAFLQPKA